MVRDYNDMSVLKRFYPYFLKKTENKIKPQSKIKTEGGATEQSRAIINEFLSFATKPTPIPSTSVTAGKAQIDTTFGFYAILQTGAPVNGHIASAPVLACLPMQDPTDNTTWLSEFTIVPKDDEISVTKQVKATGDGNFKDETITNIGDTVTYEIIAKLPEYGTDIVNAGITYTLTDELPKGITIQGTPTIELNAKNGIGYTDGSSYTSYTYTPAAGTDPAKYEVTFNDYKTDINTKYDQIKITYNAVLNENAVIERTGNINNVTLKYSAYKGETQPATATADAKVYTMGLDIKKVDADNTTTALAGAEFEVYDNAGGTGAPIKFVETTGGGDIQKYRVATSTDPEDTTTTTIKVTADGTNIGKLMLDGLNDTTYYLKETTAPAGYTLPKNLVAVDVQPTNPNDYNGTELAFDETRLSKEITNSTSIDLPVTGGIGTVLYTIVGLLLMAGAAYFLFFSRKRSTK